MFIDSRVDTNSPGRDRETRRKERQRARLAFERSETGPRSRYCLWCIFEDNAQYIFHKLVLCVRRVVGDLVDVIPVILLDLLRGCARLTTKSTVLIRPRLAMAVVETTPWLRFAFGDYCGKPRFRPTFSLQSDRRCGMQNLECCLCAPC